MKLSQEDRALIAQVVDRDPQLAAARDAFLKEYHIRGGRHMGPVVASVLLYEVGHWLSEQDKDFER